MADLIAGVSPLQVGAGGLVVIIVLLILTGRLVPRQTLRDTQADRDYWRQAWQTSEESRRAQDAQFSELLELAHTTEQILRSLPQGDKR